MICTRVFVTSCLRFPIAPPYFNDHNGLLIQPMDATNVLRLSALQLQYKTLLWLPFFANDHCRQWNHLPTPHPLWHICDNTLWFFCTIVAIQPSNHHIIIVGWWYRLNVLLSVPSFVNCKKNVHVHQYLYCTCRQSLLQSDRLSFNGR